MPTRPFRRDRALALASDDGSQRVRLGSIQAYQHLEVELPNGRAAIGVVRDDPSTSAVFVNVEGRGPPPFEVW